jgi:iron-sulfur cluster assembly accessory protein
LNLFQEIDRMEMNSATAAVPEAPKPAAPRAPRKPPITMTAKAVEMVKNAMEQQKLEGFTLRVGVIGGGCSGFNYDLDLVKETRPTDFLFEINGLKVAVDPMSAQYLKGTDIDYVEGLQGAGFKFGNPNAKNTCGCGSSFST